MGERPSVVVLSFSPIARDPRVLRQVQLLSTVADVTTCGYGPSPEGVVRHVQVPDTLAPWRTGRAGRVLGPALLALRRHRRLYFGSPRIAFVLDALPPGSMDVVVANDALAAPLALALEPRAGVHSDLHEYAPRQGEDRLLWRLLVAPLMTWACRSVRHVASVTTVAQGIAEEYERELGFTPRVVPNAAAYRPDLVPTAVGSPVRLVHIGIAGRARRLETMIDAAGLVESRSPGTLTLDLVLAPGDPTYITELAERAQAVGGSVRVLPPVPFDEIVPVLTRYDVGVFVCPPTTFNLLHALPNKLFEFVQARLAVVVGPSPEMARIVTEHALGLVADGFTVEDTERALAALRPETVTAFKAASHVAAEVLSAERLSAPWLDAVENLVGRPSGENA
ncbi:glycosyltransferase family 4 protein [Sanguibacter antarcticus]|uniref:Glycosyltransferase involved in cell wall biosynthesis n=1 Tax=Sanguibacter antarcticus TaxID=372484 RepID=A0A2A9E2T2_9MICO|nr:glycosyltransferase family 4 protein [Sanguibacter antarcticus]PFG32509.1 glycosyltransferase involved in cell wall biosynthesis [Sanguibacter antarcticus]